MAVRKAETFPPVTMGHIRGHGCRDLLVYCSSGRCRHGATMNGDGFPDDLPIRSLCGRMVCTVCGMIGADVGRIGRRMLISGTYDLSRPTQPAHRARGPGSP